MSDEADRDEADEDQANETVDLGKSGDPAANEQTTRFAPIADDTATRPQAWSAAGVSDDSDAADFGSATDFGDATDFEAADADADAPPSDYRGWLQRNAVRVGLAAIVVGALVAAGVAFAMGVFNDRGSVGGTDIGQSERLAENAFTRSVAGDCLTWPENRPGDPAKVDCATEHRFEVAGALNTALLPGSEFGDSASWPGPERFGQIRDEQCPVIVNRYLNGRLDPDGRFSVGLMYPSDQQWAKGARELRCGLQITGADGTPQLFSGKVGEQDQSFQWPAGTCIGIDAATRRVASPPTVVNCSEPHAFQTTGIVDLAQRFGDATSGKPWPGEKAQNEYLTTICPGQAERFVGGKQKLDATTLNTQWSVISEPRWLSGSRKVVCFLGLPDRGGFATLVGDARGTVLVNGKVPQPPAPGPSGRATPTPVPLPPGVTPNPFETAAPAG
ncbi:septum formation family protein [Gordonia sp. L191]|uniref:septum formation family protein n=1 Tax=Gordonia sp. L191 TaxID=2982699 RepID=UPI0024BFD857|nr:septum formation family protein [Gordonia sp. L191]WHU46645.1 septum formation family protein [Gordonia sp. L191]